MKKHNLAFVDVETTGTNPQVHEIIEIAGIIARQVPQEGKGSKLEVIEEFEYKIKPERLEVAEPQALRINGYNDADWLFAPGASEIFPKLGEKLKDTVMVGQNVNFDWSFVNATFDRLKIKNPMHYHKIDIMPIFFAKTYHDPKVQWYNLASILEYFGLKNEKAHTALADIKATFEAYKKLLNI